MAVVITARYEGNLRCIATHEPSGTALATDAPRDNQGLGESFSPTDLVATALSVCVMTTMGIVARRDGIPLSGMTARIEKHMVIEPARRIGRLPLVVTVPGSFTPEQKRKLEAAGHACPVHRSLHPDIDAQIRFEWTG